VLFILSHYPLSTKISVDYLLGDFIDNAVESANSCRPVAMDGIVPMLKEVWSHYTEAHMTTNSVFMTVGS
jgi:hypothetical protein